MENKIRKPDWNPRAGEVLNDQLSAYDKMRKNCPVAFSEFMQWSVFSHKDVLRIILDHDTFSNAVSQHLSVPAGMDPPEHTIYRRIINKYFEPEKMAAFEPMCREIVTELLQFALNQKELEMMNDFAVPFAVRVQWACLGWPKNLHEPLADWTRRNYEATL